MNIAAFDFELPESLIAQHPLPNRAESRLLYYDRIAGKCRESRFAGIVDLLRPGDLLVVNDTRVLPARLDARKPSGGVVEIMLERMLSSHTMLAQLRANRTPREGQVLRVAGHELVVEGREDRFFILRLEGNTSLQELLETHGATPLPPYIRRAPEGEDLERYQTVYARVPGAVAAPTAGLHFTPDLLAELESRDIGIANLTLHVGAGTFLPVQGEDLDSHRMHAEWITVSPELCTRIEDTRAAGGRLVAVGTTVVRALESAARDGGLQPFTGDTRLFIKPGFQFRVVDCLVTNFHLPRSTLLVLVSTFAGYDRVMEMYRYAVEQEFRFFSYGDAMWLEREGSDAA